VMGCGGTVDYLVDAVSAAMNKIRQIERLSHALRRFPSRRSPVRSIPLLLRLCRTPASTRRLVQAVEPDLHASGSRPLRLWHRADILADLTEGCHESRIRV
jgi:hypothetical protein